MVNHEENVRKILQQYGILPDELIERGDSTIVHAKDQSFIVRKMQVTEAQIATWEAVFHEAYRHHMHAVLPVYKTINGSMHVKQGRDYYYLTPYIQADDSIQISEFLTSIGNIHKKTKKEIVVPKEEFVAHFTSYVHKIEEKHLYLQQIIDLFEQQHYMSPFELQVCTHFHIIDRICKQSLSHTNSFLTLCEATENNEITWASSLCHNQLTLENAVKGNELYISNWERASYGNATSDLVSFFQEAFRINVHPLDAYVDGMMTYEEVYELLEVEEHLLRIHLLHVIPYVEAVQSYVNHDKKRHMPSQVIALERLYRSLANSFFMFHEVEQQKRKSYSTKSDQMSSK